MALAERRSREKDQIRYRVLAAARELFAESGYDAVTVRAVAERAEYSSTVIYTHFGDKAALMRELVRDDYRALARAMQRAARAVEDPVDRLRQAGVAYTEFALKYPAHYRLMFMLPTPADPSLAHVAIDPDARGQEALDAYAGLQALVRQVQAAGRLRPEFGDIVLVAHALWLSLHGVVSMHIAHGDTGDGWTEARDPRTIAAFLMDRLFESFIVPR